jgi:hypothetical protein
MTAFNVKAPAPYASFSSQDGSSYTADANGNIANVDVNDLSSLLSAGCVLQGNGSFLQRLRLIEFKTAAGLTLGAAGATVLGISSTPGTVLSLVSESANNNTKADIAIQEVVLSPSYSPGANINVAIAESIAGAGTLSVKNLTVTAWLLNPDGSQTALVVSAAQALVAAANVLNYTITGVAAMLPGSRILLKLLVDLTETATSGMVVSIFSVNLS